MKRRDFLNIGALVGVGGAIATPALAAQFSVNTALPAKGKTKNIIFMVADGMSHGTLNMADLLLQRKEGRSSNWIKLYREQKATRAYMDTASANSMVTDSAAGSSSWGGGVRVNNGALNVGPNGTAHKPILQKFKDKGKAVGCVTTVPITHATPAGFCVNSKSRGSQDEIAAMYLDLKFDVMMGGGTEFFSADKRKDKRDMFAEFAKNGIQVAQTKQEMENCKTGTPMLGVFYEDGLPYTLDQLADQGLISKIPTLADMTRKAISQLSKNPNGFVLQVEGGKVDWGAHANDLGALIYDQVAFDDAIAVAIEFAEKQKDTLVVITTDHGNASPGLIKSKNVDECFDKVQKFKYTNEWILNGIRKTDSAGAVIERINEAQGIVITNDEAVELLTHYSDLDNEGIYNAYKLPYKRLAQIQQTYTSVGWSGMDHSGEFVELGMFGPGSETLPPFVKNTDLHNFMLKVTGLMG
ncbi:MAG TPA: alkaline phosphatase [Draconibacterium sp.]|nr:alkaline phosphatase [Draconibacterium sp.]